jgi:hypothetical protein
MILRLFFLTWLLAVPAATAAAAQPVFPPASPIGLEPAGDLKLADRFPGFEDPDRKMIVSIIDLPAARYEEVLNTAFAESPPGLRNVTRESFPYQNGIGYLLTADATEEGIEWRRFYLIAIPFGTPADAQFVAFVKVGVPQPAREIYSDEAVRRMLASMTFRDVPVEEQLDQLPYRLSELSGFRVARAAGGAVFLIDGAGNDMNRQSYMIVSVGAGAAANAEERARGARNLLAAAPLRDITIQNAESMRLSNSPAYEIRAQAQNAAGAAVSLVQWVRFGSGGFMQIVGVGPRADWDGLFPRFRAVRDGIAPR